MGRQTKNPRQNAPPVSPDQPPVPSLKAPGLRLTQRLVNDAPVTGFKQRIADHEVKGALPAPNSGRRPELCP